MATKEALQQPTYTKEARPTTGTLQKSAGFGSIVFGTAKFGGTTSGYIQTKEALATNSQTKEALQPM